MAMRFKQATDELLKHPGLPDLADELGVSIQSVRQARAAETSHAFRPPPPGWESALLQVTQRWTAHYEDLERHLRISLESRTWTCRQKRLATLARNDKGSWKTKENAMAGRDPISKSSTSAGTRRSKAFPSPIDPSNYSAFSKSFDELLRATVEVLCGQRAPLFRYEKELRLCQLKIWLFDDVDDGFVGACAARE
jgi:hypothetical protein